MSAARETVAIFGGSFDPPHVAHVLVVASVLATTDVDRIVVIPTYQHPLEKRAHAPFEHRVAMCEIAFRDLRRVELSRIEQELGGASRTLRTLEELRRRMPSVAMRLVIGADLLAETSRWYAFDRIERLAPPLVVGRAGYAAPPENEVAIPDVSSTEIRERLGRGADLDGLVPRAVAAYVEEHGLYGAEPTA